MAIYVTADLHGLPPEEFRALLDKAGFSQDDWLYVLGDVIDRGQHGVRLLRQLMLMPNAQLTLGNHEDMLLSCRFIFDEITDDMLETLDERRMGELSAWLANGAEPTLKALRQLNRYDPDLLADILDYLEDAPLYDVVSVGGRSFLLTHAGLGNFSPGKRLSEYTRKELLWTRPKPADRYFEKTITVFGHTPTMLYDENNVGKAFRTETWIDIDTGTKPMLLRLDDLAEFYPD